MAGIDLGDSPLEAVAGAASFEATEAFALLGNETRLAILLALWEAYDPGSNDNTLSFSELYDRVDYDNPGNFGYHLEKLTGQFIRQPTAGAGYELRTAGLKLVQAVIAGSGIQETNLEPSEVDRNCWLCGASAAVTYRDSVLYLVCTECEGRTTDGTYPDGYLNAIRFHPAGVRDQEPEDLYAAGTVTAYRHMRTMFEGLCSVCSGQVDASLVYCEAHDSRGLCATCGRKDPIAAVFQCRVCKDYHATKPTVLAIFHPAVLAFYEELGVSTRWHVSDFESVKHVVKLVTDHEMTLVQEDPPRVRVTITREGDEIRLTFDESVTVVDVRRDASGHGG